MVAPRVMKNFAEISIKISIRQEILLQMSQFQCSLNNYK